MGSPNIGCQKTNRTCNNFIESTEKDVESTTELSSGIPSMPVYASYASYASHASLTDEVKENEASEGKGDRTD
jgi:hypothetical protein